MILSSVSYSQTPITQDNFQTAINTCLTTNPEDGMCSESEYDCFLFRNDTWRIKSNSETKFLKNSIYFLTRINVCGFPIN